MEGDPDTKRPRLEYEHPGHPTARNPHQHPPPNIAPPPQYPHALPPPGPHQHQHHHHHYQQPQQQHPQPPPPPHPLGQPHRDSLPDPRGLPPYQSLPPGQHQQPPPPPHDGRPSYGSIAHHSSRSISSESGTPRPSSSLAPGGAQPKTEVPLPPLGQEHMQPHMDHGVQAAGYPMDHHGNGSIPNGLPFHPPPDQYPGHVVPPPHHSYPPTPTTGFAPSNPYSGPTNYNVTRRKQVRAQQACNNCRQRKQKCDESRPCGYCKQEGLECEYREVPPPKTDRTMQEILKRLDDIIQKQEDFDQRLDHFQKTVVHSPSLARFPGDAGQQAQSLNTGDAAAGLEPGKASLVEPDIDEASLGSHATGAHHLMKAWPYIKGFFEQAGVTDEEYVQHEEEAQQQDFKLYSWIQPREEANYHSFGLGSPPHSETQESAATHSPPDPARATRGQPSFSERDTGGWNPDGSLKLDPSTIWRLFDSYMENMWIIHPFIDARYLKQLIERFISLYSPVNTRSSAWTMSNSSMGDSFSGAASLKRKRQSGPADTHSSPGSPGFNFHPSTKRPEFERTIETALVLLVLALGNILEHDEFLLADPPQSFGRGFQSSNYSNQHASNQGFVKPSPPQTYSNLSFTSAPSPSLEATRQRAGSQGDAFDSTYGGEKQESERSNRLSRSERVPGIAYFAYATDILGNTITGNDVPHAQACLLAGLFYGQIGRVLDSWAWINNACTAIVLMIRSRYKDRINRERMEAEARIEAEAQKEIEYQDQMKLGDKKKYVWYSSDLQLFCTLFWSALQLDSDIRAELDRLPTELLSGYSLEIPRPQYLLGAVTSPDQSDAFVELQNRKFDVSGVLIHFVAQLEIRKLLNRAHMSLYANDQTPSSQAQARTKPRWSDANAPLQWSMLQDWRRLLPPNFQWEDSDPPAKDVNSARLRGKYFGASYVITRPFLHYAVHFMKERELESAYSKGSPGMNGDFSDDDDNLPKALPEIPTKDEQQMSGPRIEDSILWACRRCITSAIKSTLAFDGLHPRAGLARRPRVTNIHGTAAAQFSNMLVLAATYKSWLHPYVPEKSLFELLDRTINFLNCLKPLSNIFAINYKVLVHVRDECLQLRAHRSHQRGGSRTPQAYGGLPPPSRPNRISSMPAAIGIDSAHSSFSSNL